MAIVANHRDLAGWREFSHPPQGAPLQDTGCVNAQDYVFLEELVARDFPGGWDSAMARARLNTSSSPTPNTQANFCKVPMLGFLFAPRSIADGFYPVSADGLIKA